MFNESRQLEAFFTIATSILSDFRPAQILSEKERTIKKMAHTEILFIIFLLI